MGNPLPVFEIKIVTPQGQPSPDFQLISKFYLKIHSQLFAIISLSRFIDNLLYRLAFLRKDIGNFEPSLTDLLGKYVPSILTVIIIVYFNRLSIELKIAPDFCAKYQSRWIAD